MSATLYDSALIAKINSWTEKAKIQVFGPTEARQRLEVLADINDDKTIKLPFIVLSRPDGYLINNSLKRPLTFNGKVISTEESDGEITICTLNAIPITLNYELNVYTRYEQEADALMRELIFNFVNYPAVRVVVPYLNTGFVHESTVRFDADQVGVNRGSVSIRTDQVFNYGISIKIDDAYLWDVRRKNTAGIALPEQFQVSYNNPNLYTTIETVSGGIIVTRDEGETEY